MIVTREHWDQVKKQNQKPLNQQAKTLLVKANESSSDQSLCLLQLADWGLENGVRLEGLSTQLLENSILGLKESKPENTMKWLDDLPENLESDPEEASATILSLIGEKLQEKLYFRP